MNLCPCGLLKPYEQCCGQYIESDHAAPTPESLMRSRYTAYCRCNINYIAKTMQGIAAKDFDFEATQDWANRIQWLSLEVNSHKIKTPTQGFVIYEARYLENGQIKTLREKSEFHRIKEQWYYVAGKMLNPHKGAS